MKFFIFVFAAGLLAHAEPLSKKPKFTVKGVGEIHVKHEVPMEPIAQPERLEILVKCGKSKTFERVAIYRMCKFEGYTYEEGTKTLSVNLFYGRVIPTTGDIVCDQHDIKTTELAGACSPTPAKK